LIDRFRLQQIQGLAREKLVEHRRMHLPVSPKEFAIQLQIGVQPFDPAKSDISGFLMQHGNSFSIGYSTAIRSAGFQNFTIAHELGHYFIDDHPLAVLAGGEHFSRSGYISKDRYEEEADAFATELLMPWKLIEPLIRMNAGGFQTIKAIADGCQSSLLASAIRYTQVTKECVAVIVSHLGVVEFMTASTSFKQITDLDWLRKKDSLPANVASRRFSTELDWIRGCHISEEGGRLGSWFPSVQDRDVEEDVVGLGSYERLLTVLVTEETDLEGEADEEYGDDYIDRWKQGIFRSKK
jgi:Zn-dependent peptidase ImmA (M78 family)